MAKTHRVLRTIPGVEHLPPGELVDASAWRTVDQLVKSRYLEPISIIEEPKSTNPPAPASADAQAEKPTAKAAEAQPAAKPARKG